MLEIGTERKTKILAFRIPEEVYIRLMEKADPEDSPSVLMRRVVKRFLDTVDSSKT